MRTSPSPASSGRVTLAPIMAAGVAIAMTGAVLLPASPARAAETDPVSAVETTAVETEAPEQVDAVSGPTSDNDASPTGDRPTGEESIPLETSTSAPGAGTAAERSTVATTVPSEQTVGDFRFRSDATDPAAATLLEYLGGDAEVTIPGEVTLDGVVHAVTVIGAGAFEHYLHGTKLTSITIPDTVVTIEEQAFMSNSLTDVRIPDSVVVVGADAFSDNLLTHVILGASVDSIGSYAFEHYDYANDAVLPLDVIFTGPPPSSFAPGGPTILSGSFAEIDDVMVSYPNEYAADVHAGGFTRPTWRGYATQRLVAVDFNLGLAGGWMATARVPEGQSFAAPDAPAQYGFAFAGWYTDEALHTPFDESVSVTENTVLYADWDLLEFLVDVTVDGVIYLVDMHDANPTATAASLTGRRSSVTIRPEVEIGGQTYVVTTIGSFSFDGVGLTSVSIPDTVVTIEEYAFAAGDVINDRLVGRNPLGDLVIPDSVETIGDYAFAGAVLTSLHLGSGLRHVGEAAFIDTGLTEVVLPEALLTIGQFAFDENHLTQVRIPDSVTDIGFMAFAGSPLSTVRLGAGVETIGARAFLPDGGLRRAAVPALDVFFSGPPASIVPAGSSGSFGGSSGVLVHYPVAFDAGTYPGGFVRPQWQGYATVALATITFDLRGSGPVPAPVVLPVDETIDSLPAPQRDGWTFTGWYLDAAASRPFDIAQPVSADITLYAGWRQTASPAGGGAAELPVTGFASVEPLIGLALLLFAGAAMLLSFGARTRRVRR